MEKLFLDDALHDQIDRDGVLTMPFLSDSELAELREFYHSMHPDGTVPQMRNGIHMTIWCSDRDYKDQIREGIARIIRPAAERNFTDYRMVSPVFIVKQQGNDTTFPIHQDWNVVDESVHRAFNLWIPLYDVDETNGALWFVKGSHRLPTHVRGAGYLFPNLYGVENDLRPNMEAAKVKAGTAVIFYHRVIHGSPHNQQTDPRVVIAVSILPKQVPLHIYFQESPEANLKVFHPKDDFIYEFDNVRDDTANKPPKGEPVAVLPPYKQVILSTKDVHTAIGKPAKTESFGQRVKQWLGLN